MNDKIKEIKNYSKAAYENYLISEFNTSTKKLKIIHVAKFFSIILIFIILAFGAVIGPSFLSKFIYNMLIKF